MACGYFIAFIISICAWRCSACTDKSRCCYFPCERLTLDHDGTQLGQVGNCGKNCTDGIVPDLNGVVHWELYLWKDTYYSAHNNYPYGDGPMVIDGEDKNMWDRCYKQCFAPSDCVSGKYLLEVRIENDDESTLKYVVTRRNRNKWAKRKDMKMIVEENESHEAVKCVPKTLCYRFKIIDKVQKNGLKSGNYTVTYNGETIKESNFGKGAVEWIKFGEGCK